MDYEESDLIKLQNLSIQHDILNESTLKNKCSFKNNIHTWSENISIQTEDSCNIKDIETFLKSDITPIEYETDSRIFSQSYVSQLI